MMDQESGAFVPLSREQVRAQIAGGSQPAPAAAQAESRPVIAVGEQVDVCLRSKTHFGVGTAHVRKVKRDGRLFVYVSAAFLTAGDVVEVKGIKFWVARVGVLGDATLRMLRATELERVGQPLPREIEEHAPEPEILAEPDFSHYAPPARAAQKQRWMPRRERPDHPAADGTVAASAWVSKSELKRQDNARFARERKAWKKSRRQRPPKVLLDPVGARS